ncbi:MAG: hypothetical protein JW876_03530 [Candidatus Krumholzibacteriota bacterium]|nr:hypothetical protein [Candidatus Krumholzibacteriota bacterium]
MSGRKFTFIALMLTLVAGAAIIGCDEDSNYDQRTVLYVSNFNEGKPFLSDVLNQGDSLYYDDEVTYKISDDYVEEDWLKVEFHNKPYNGIIDPASGALGDFLLTGYDVSFIPMGGAAVPVQNFSGTMSTLVPADAYVEAYILLVPFAAKLVTPLFDIHYSNSEILANAYITFHGHEVQTERDIDFSASIVVGFADVLNEDRPDDD